jgi:hypothetical protein
MSCSSGRFSPPSPRRCQIGCMDHTACQQLWCFNCTSGIQSCLLLRRRRRGSRRSCRQDDSRYFSRFEDAPQGFENWRRRCEVGARRCCSGDGAASGKQSAATWRGRSRAYLSLWGGRAHGRVVVLRRVGVLAKTKNRVKNLLSHN